MPLPCAIRSTLCVLLLAGMAGSACAADTGPIRVGAVSSLTGPTPFPESSAAVRAYFDTVNAGGGVAGRKLELVVEDDKGDPAQARAAARRLAADPRLLALVGGASIVDCTSNAETWQAAGLIALQGTGVEPACFNAGHIVPVNAGPYLSMRNALQFARSTLKAQRPCAFLFDIPGMRPAYQAMVDRWQREDGKPLTLTRYFTPADDPAALVRQAAESQCDAVVHTGVEPLVIAWSKAWSAAAQIDFRYAATDEQFVTIAKLRSARRLWSRVLELSGATPAGQRQHAVTSRPMCSAYDPYVNMLRATVAAFAAGVGGAEAVTALPFDEPLGLPVPFSRRIARNISSLLISESHVATVADAGGGSHLIEQLTDEVAQTSWSLFGELDANGGIVAALADGRLHDRIAAVVAERERLIATRAKPLTGLSEFPNLAEESLERRPYGRTFPVQRWGASYEALRREAAASPVFVATLGTVAQHTARATFLSNLLAAGGIDVAVAGATADVADVLAAYDAAGQPDVVALAGPDDLYAERGAETIEALRGAGARHVILAGKPRDLKVDDSAAMGVDALAFLRRTREVLG